MIILYNKKFHVALSLGVPHIIFIIKNAAYNFVKLRTNNVELPQNVHLQNNGAEWMGAIGRTLGEQGRA
jgi:hypothetical protein